MKRSLVRIDPWVYPMGALLLLTVPLDWLIAAMLAAACHEGAHLLAIWGLGGEVLGIRIGVRGATISARIPGKAQELLCALAGPLGSLMLVCACRYTPKLAVCGCIQGLFNLLPIYPLDGGRLLRCALEIRYPGRGRRIAKKVELWLLLILASLMLMNVGLPAMGAIPAMVFLRLAVRILQIKKPCKWRRIGVQ